MSDIAVIEKTLNTRIINKHGTYAEWAGSDVTLKKGEIALVEFTTKQTATDENGNITVQYVPTYLMKIGDGSTAFRGLNWLSAPASDVHDWAKSASINDVNITGNQAIINLTADLEEAEKAISALQEAVTGGMHFIGISTTDPATGTVTIGGEAITPATGDIVIYKVTGTDARDVEYVYDGSGWIELGDVTAEAKRISELEGWRITQTDRMAAVYNMLGNGSELATVLILDCGTATSSW